MQRRTKWLLAAGLIGIPVVGGLTLLFLAKQHAAKIEPYIRDQAVEYLRGRFNAEVEIADLHRKLDALTDALTVQTKLVNALVSARRQELSATVRTIEHARRHEIEHAAR